MTTKVTENLLEPKSMVSNAAIATTSGANIDVPAIPSWVKRITINFAGVSVNATANLAVTIGDSGGLETSGYVSGYVRPRSGIATSGGTSTANYRVAGVDAAAYLLSGQLVLSLIDAAANQWSLSGNLINEDGTQAYQSSGHKSLSDVLTQLRISTDAGAFDAGKINLVYEG